MPTLLERARGLLLFAACRGTEQVAAFRGDGTVLVDVTRRGPWRQRRLPAPGRGESRPR